VNVFYVLIRTTENYEFDKIRTAGMTGNATNYKNSQGDNPICSTRDKISQPSQPISPRAATVHKYARSQPKCSQQLCFLKKVRRTNWLPQLIQNLPLEVMHDLMKPCRAQMVHMYWTVARKSSIEGLYVCARVIDIWKFDKTALIYSF